jgi:hypothetical protein
MQIFCIYFEFTLIGLAFVSTDYSIPVIMFTYVSSIAFIVC